jgi:hypothetical protein
MVPNILTGLSGTPIVALDLNRVNVNTMESIAILPEAFPRLEILCGIQIISETVSLPRVLIMNVIKFSNPCFRTRRYFWKQYNSLKIYVTWRFTRIPENKGHILSDWRHHALLFILWISLMRTEVSSITGSFWEVSGQRVGHPQVYTFRRGRADY